MAISCIITDDEPLARRGLENYVKKTQFLELVCSFSSALELSKFLKNNAVDLLFLDIQMPDMTGLELMKTLQYPQR